jgi:hypothetical protein
VVSTVVKRSALLVVAMLLVGCGNVGGSATASSSGAAESSAAASASSSEGTTAGSLCAVDHTPCELPGGTYSAAPFEPAFSFTIEGSWQNDRAFSDGGGISQDTGGIYWASGVERGRLGDEEVEIGATPEQFIAFLQSLSLAGATVSAQSEQSVGDHSGASVDVESGDEPLPGLYLIDADAFNLAPNEKARFIVLDVEGETVVFVVDAFASADFDAWLATAQPVLDSVTWD